MYYGIGIIEFGSIVLFIWSALKHTHKEKSIARTAARHSGQQHEFKLILLSFHFGTQSDHTQKRPRVVNRHFLVFLRRNCK